MARAALVVHALCLAALVGPTGAETALGYLGSELKFSKFKEWVEQTEEVRNYLESGEGPYTLFVPTNAAVKAFLTSGLQGLIEKDAEDAIRKIVGYHVVTAADFLKPQDIPLAYAGMATTLYDGRKLLVERNGEDIIINQDVKVVNAQVAWQGANTMVYLVNKVLAYPGWFPTNTILGYMRNKKDHRAFYSTIWHYREELGLTQPGPITVFVPTNKAMARVGLGAKGTDVSTLLKKDRDTMLRIMKYHIVHGKFMTQEELAVPGVVQTLDFHEGKGSFVTHQTDATGTIDINNGESKVEAKKSSVVEALDGIYYPIDRVLLPPGVEIPDVNYSATRVVELKLSSQRIAATPEPEPIVYNPNKKTKRERSPLLYLVLAFMFLLFTYRIVVPDPSGSTRALKKDTDATAAQERPDYALALMLLLLVCVPMFSSMQWLLPGSLRWVSQQQVATYSDAAPAVPVNTEQQTRNEAEVSRCLERVGHSVYRKQLLAYGLDRLELLAIASPADGVRAGVKPAHWTEISAQARQQLPAFSPSMLDPTPQPPFKPVQLNKWVAPTQDPIEEAMRIAKEFTGGAGAVDPDEHAAGKTTAPVTNPPAYKPPVNVAPAVDKQDTVVALINIQSTGASSVECTLGTKHGQFDFKDQSKFKHVMFARINQYAEAATLRPQFGKKGPFFTVTPDAKLVIVFVATRSVGKVQTADSEFKCKGQLKTMMRGDAKKNLFTLEKYVKLPAEARALCESNNNLMVKALANVSPDVPITPENTAEAIRNLKHIDVIMIEEEMEMKSMYMLMDAIGLPMGAYISCTPYEDQATNEWSNRVVDTLSRDNQGDRDLYSEVHYIFNTKYAGTAEQKVNAGATVCTQPHVCFDECDKNGEKKAKNPFKDVKMTLSRSTSRQSVLCASSCQLPPPTFDMVRPL